MFIYTTIPCWYTGMVAQLGMISFAVDLTFCHLSNDVFQLFCSVSSYIRFNILHTIPSFRLFFREYIKCTSMVCYVFHIFCGVYYFSCAFSIKTKLVLINRTLTTKKNLVWFFLGNFLFIESTETFILNSMHYT